MVAIIPGPSSTIMKILTKKLQGFFLVSSLTCHFGGTWGRNPPIEEKLKKFLQNKKVFSELNDMV